MRLIRLAVIAVVCAGALERVSLANRGRIHGRPLTVVRHTRACFVAAGSFVAAGDCCQFG